MLFLHSSWAGEVASNGLGGSDFFLQILPGLLVWGNGAFCLAALSCLTAMAVGGPLLYWWWRDHPGYGRNVGPKVYPLIGSLPAVLRNRHRILDWTTDNMRAAAPFHTIRNVVPLGGQDFFDTAHPLVVEHIVRHNFETYQKGPDVHDVFQDLLGDGIFNVDGELWRQQRKVVAQEFSAGSLRDLLMERVAMELRHRLLPILKEAGDAGVVVDLQDLFTRFSFDNMCHLALGMDPACLHPSFPRVPFEQAFNDAALICVSRFYTAPFVWKLKRRLNLGSERRFRDARKVIDDYAFSLIRARRSELELAATPSSPSSPSPPPSASAPQRLDLLSRYIVSEGKYSDAFLRDVVVSYLIAGKDSTPSVLAWFFWLLSQHPHVESACYNEVMAVLQSRAPPTSSRILGGKEGEGDGFFFFSYEEVRGMPYLHAALSEVLRLYPSAPASMRCAMKADVLPDGTKVRAGARMGYNSYALGRMPGVWGDDCLQFRPERWLGPAGEFRPESPYKFTAFHAGPRMCPGRDVAYVQMKLIVASLLPRFSFAVASGYVPQAQFSLVMRLRHGLPVTVHPRSHSLINTDGNTGNNGNAGNGNVNNGSGNVNNGSGNGNNSSGNSGNSGRQQG